MTKRKKITFLIVLTLVLITTIAVLVGCNYGKEYILTLDVNGGNSLQKNAEVMKFGEKYVLPVPTRDSYVFLGWYIDNVAITNSDGISIEVWKYNEDKTATAMWSTLEDSDSNLIMENTTDGVSVIGIVDKSVTSIVVPDYITEIEEGAFAECNKLVRITLPFVGSNKSVKNDNVYTFGYIFGTNSYTGSVETTQHIYSATSTSAKEVKYYLPETLTTITIKSGVITDGAFENCKSISSVNIGNAVTEISYKAFAACTGIQSIIIPNNVTQIGEKAFYNCTNLNTVKIGQGVKNIAKEAFYNCYGIKNIEMQYGIQTIGQDAFYYCISIATMTMPSSLQNISKDAFKSAQIKNLYFTGTTYDWCNITFGNGYANPLNNVDAFYINNSLATNITLDSKVENIKAFAFWGYNKLTSITFSSTISSIGESAFEKCDKLASLIINKSIKSIGLRAFYQCSSIVSINLTEGTETIGGSAFAYCSKLKYINIPHSISRIGGYAFQNCLQMAEITYSGTTTEWARIEKDVGWNASCPLGHKVICTNGEVIY